MKMAPSGDLHGPGSEGEEIDTSSLPPDERRGERPASRKIRGFTKRSSCVLPPALSLELPFISTSVILPVIISKGSSSDKILIAAASCFLTTVLILETPRPLPQAVATKSSCCQEEASCRQEIAAAWRYGRAAASQITQHYRY